MPMGSGSVRERLYALGPGIVAAASFGIGDTFAKVAFAAGADVLTLALARGVAGVGILFLYLRFGAPPLPATPRMRAIALGLGVLFAAIVYGLFKAIDLITVPIAVLTYFIYPLLTGIGAALFGVERLGWQGMLAALVAFFGLALTIGAYPQHLSVAGLAFAVGAAATMNWQAPRTGYGWIALAIVSVCTAVAVLTLYISTTRIGPFRSALIMNLEPLLATVLSAIILGEVITPLQGLGAGIMLAALVAFQSWR